MTRQPTLARQICIYCASKRHCLGCAAGCAFVQFAKWSQAEAAMEAHNSKTRLGTSEVPLVVKFADAKRKDPTPHHVRPPFILTGAQSSVDLSHVVSVAHGLLIVPVKKECPQKGTFGLKWLVSCSVQTGACLLISCLICRCKCMVAGWADHWGLGI